MSTLSLPRESILVSTPSSLLLLDLAHPNTHSPITSFKPYTSPISPHALSIVPPSPLAELEGLVAWGETGRKTLIHVAPFHGGTSTGSGAGTATVRWIPPQQISCLAFSPDGSLLLTGCEDGRAYLWEVASGKLRCTWDPHFRAVSAICWSLDGVVATGGEDGRICVWSVAGLFHPSSSSASGAASSSISASAPRQPQAYATFTSHLLPITSLRFSPEAGVANGTGLKLWSSSKDGTVRVWDIRTRTGLTTFTIGGSSATRLSGAAGTEVRDVVVDPSGRFAFAACAPSSPASSSKDGSGGETAGSGGKVYRIDLYRRVSSNGSEFEAAGGQDELLGESNQSKSTTASSSSRGSVSTVSLPSPSMSPTSIALSPSSAHLLVGTANPPSILVVDIRSSQILRTIALPDTSGAVTNVQSFYRPYSNEGPSSSSSSATAQRAAMAPRVVASTLDRMVSECSSSAFTIGGEDADEDGDADDDEEYWAICPDRTGTRALQFDEDDDGRRWSTGSVTASLLHTAPAGDKGSTSHQDQKHLQRIAELGERNKSLEAQLKRAAQINDEIWKAAVGAGAGANTKSGKKGGTVTAKASSAATAAAKAATAAAREEFKSVTGADQSPPADVAAEDGAPSKATSSRGAKAKQQDREADKKRKR